MFLLLLLLFVCLFSCLFVCFVFAAVVLPNTQNPTIQRGRRGRGECASHEHLPSSRSRSAVPRPTRSWTGITTRVITGNHSPGEIKRREVSWTLTKRLDIFEGPGEIKRRGVELDPQVSRGEIKNREVELGLRGGLFFFASVVSHQRSYGHCLCDSVPHSS